MTVNKCKYDPLTFFLGVVWETLLFLGAASCEGGAYLLSLSLSDLLPSTLWSVVSNAHGINMFLMHIYTCILTQVFKTVTKTDFKELNQNVRLGLKYIEKI